jgi:hypothetical protein
MKAKFLFGLFFAVLIVFVSCDTNKQLISLSELKPTVLKENGVEIFQQWQFDDAAYLWETNFVQPNSIKVYKDSLSKILGKDTVNFILLKRAYQDKTYQLVETKNGDSINAQLIHSCALGKIRPINYLESQLLDYQMCRYPLLSHPTEFHGFILIHDSLNQVKVYFAASDQPWPPKPHVILEALENDLTMGWTFKYHLHNHYEPKTNGYVGILAPSTNDVQFYRFLVEDYDLDYALVTNGFHTVEIQKEDFQKLKSPEDN